MANQKKNYLMLMLEAPKFFNSMRMYNELNDTVIVMNRDYKGL